MPAKEIQAHTDSIRNRISLLAEMDRMICPQCDIISDNKDKCECGESLVSQSLYDYFDDNLGVEYTVDEDGRYISVSVTIESGRPGTYVDTGKNRVELYWGTDSAFSYFDPEVSMEIDSIFEERYKDAIASLSQKGGIY